MRMRRWLINFDNFFTIKASKNLNLKSNLIKSNFK